MTKKVKKSKDSKTSATFASYEEAEKAKKDLTASLGKARDEFRAFLKDNGLKNGKDYSGDKKHGKMFNTLQGNISSLEEQRAAAIKYTKENKKAKAPKERNTKYVYPDDVMNADDVSLAKKQYRTKIRGKANRAGVSVDEYLQDPGKYDEQAKKKTKEKKSSEKSSKAEKPSKKKGKKEKVKEKPEKEEKKSSKKPSKKKKKTED